MENQTKPSASPVGEKLAQHPWEERTGREYFEDLAGESAFLNGAKILVGGKCYIRYEVRPILGYQDGNQVLGPTTRFWEMVPDPKDLSNARRLD